MDPVTNPKQYDKLIVDGAQSPGICKLSSPTREYGWDQQKAQGNDGAAAILNGSGLAEFEAEIYLWLDPDGTDHFARWEKFRPVLQRPVKQGDKKALDIYHPQLAELGIRMVVVKSISAPQPDGKGGATVKIKFLEYAPKKKLRSVKVDAAGKPISEKANPNADIDAAQAQLNDMTKRQNQNGADSVSVSEAMAVTY